MNFPTVPILITRVVKSVGNISVVAEKTERMQALHIFIRIFKIDETIQ